MTNNRLQINFMVIDSWIAMPRCRSRRWVQHIPLGNGFLLLTLPIVPTEPGAPPAGADFSFVLAPVLLGCGVLLPLFLLPLLFSIVLLLARFRCVCIASVPRPGGLDRSL